MNVRDNFDFEYKVEKPTKKKYFHLLQLVMEYCLGSASDLLEGKFYTCTSTY